MSLDRFGRAAPLSGGLKNDQMIMRSPISYTSEGNLDCDNKKLCNVKDPESNVDAANRKYVNEKIEKDLLQHQAMIQKALKSMNDTLTAQFNVHIKEANQSHTKTLNNETQLEKVKNTFMQINKDIATLQGQMQETVKHFDILETKFSVMNNKIISVIKTLNETTIRQNIYQVNGDIEAVKKASHKDFVSVQKEMNEFVVKTLLNNAEEAKKKKKFEDWTRDIIVTIESQIKNLSDRVKNCELK